MQQGSITEYSRWRGLDSTGWPVILFKESTRMVEPFWRTRYMHCITGAG